MSKLKVNIKNNLSYIYIFILILATVNPFHFFFRVTKIEYNIFFESLQITTFILILIFCLFYNFKIHKKYFLILFIPFIFLTLENIHYFAFNKNYGYKLIKNILYISFFYFVFWFLIDNIKLDKKIIKKTIIKYFFFINYIFIFFYVSVFILEFINVISIKELSNNNFFDKVYFQSNSFIPYYSAANLILLLFYGYNIKKINRYFLYIINLIIIIYIGKLGTIFSLLSFFLFYYILFNYKLKQTKYLILLFLVFQLIIYFNYENIQKNKNVILKGFDFSVLNKFLYTNIDTTIANMQEFSEPLICYNDKFLISCNWVDRKNKNFFLEFDPKILKMSGQIQSSIIRNVTLKDSLTSFLQSPIIGNGEDFTRNQNRFAGYYVHNLFFYTLSSYGFVGFMSLTILLFILIEGLYTNVRQKISTISFFLTSFFFIATIPYWYLIIFAVLNIESKIENKNQ